LALNLESILRAQMRKIVLQHYLPKAAVSNRSKASPYSTTSSARSRIDVGNTIPNLFAVLTLTTSSNFVGNSAGTSLGFEPRTKLGRVVLDRDDNSSVLIGKLKRLAA
jgi:hypothetical protein